MNPYHDERWPWPVHFAGVVPASADAVPVAVQAVAEAAPAVVSPPTTAEQEVVLFETWIKNMPVVK
jgi:hypothetical protein